MVRRALVLAIGASLALVGLIGCGGQASSGGTGTPQTAAGAGTQPAGGAANGARAASGARKYATIQVQAVTVQVGPLVTDNDTTGTVVPVTQSQVAAQVAGVVQRIVKKAGEWVNAGDTVVQLDDAALKIAVQNAQASLENAKINLTVAQQSNTASSPRLQDQLQSAQNAYNAAQKNYDSQKKLFDLGGISSASLDSSKSQLDQAHANLMSAQTALDQNNQADTQNLAQLKLAVDQASNQLQLAQLNLQNAAIKAPFAGQISAVNSSPGMYVGQNSAVFVLVSLDKQINFTVPPVDAPAIQAGRVVHFAYGGQSYPVSVQQAAAAPISGVVPMVASVPPGIALPYGAVGTISYSLTLATGPLVPVAALETRAAENYVYTVVNGTAAEQVVSILAESGATAVVTGLQAGMQVILNAPPGLLAGSVVQVAAAGSQTRTGGGQAQQGAQGQQGQGGTQGGASGGTQGGASGGTGTGRQRAAATGTQGGSGGGQQTQTGSQPAQAGQGGQR